MKMKDILTGLFFCALLLSAPAVLRGQTSLLNYGAENYIRLELNKPFFYGDYIDDVGFINSANFINAQFSRNDKWAFTFELPISITDFFDESSVSIGNIQIGVNYLATNGKAKAEFSVGLPTAKEDEDAVYLNAFADITERLVAFNPDIVPIRLTGQIHDTNKKGFTYLVRGGIEYANSLSDDLDSEWLLGFHTLAGYTGNNIKAIGGISSIGSLSGEDLDLSERFVESVLLNFEWLHDKWRPGLIIRIPLDSDFRDLYNLSVGLSVAYFVN